MQPSLPLVARSSSSMNGLRGLNLMCDKMIAKSAARCKQCAALNRHQDPRNDEEKHSVDPKWLIRGTISKNGGSGYTQFSQE